MFHTKELDQDRIIQEIGDQCTHTKDKPDLDGCAGCRAELYKKKYYTIRLKLKTTSFKENVMKECKLLFFDKEFAMKLDENKNLIGFKNGVYDCLTQKFRDGTAEDCVSMCTNLEYNEKLKYHDHACWPEVRKFLESILPIESVREYFVKHLSRCLSGVYTQDFHILTGEGSNGKSMLLNLMMTCFGEYAYKVNIALFTQKRGRAGAAAPELVRMKGKRFVMMSEPDQDDSLTDGFLKEVTGSEKIPCRDLYGGSKQMMEMEVQAKFHMACNVKPKVTDTTNGTWRRLKVIQFRSKFVHNPVGEHEYPIDETIMQKVQSVEWAECFMSYLIHLYTEGHGHTKLAPPTEVEQYINEYKGESDVIARFLSDYVHIIDKTAVEDPGMPAYPEPVSWSTIATTFQTWKRENEVGNRGSATELKKRLVEAYEPMPRGGWTSFRFGPS
jgi:P4 family phage/plasmid primase-like protien